MLVTASLLLDDDRPEEKHIVHSRIIFSSNLYVQDAWDEYVAEHWYPVLQSTYGQHWRQSFGNEVLAMQQLCMQQPSAAAGLTSLMRGLSISPAKAAGPRTTAFSPCPEAPGAAGCPEGAVSTSREAVHVPRPFQPPPPSGWRSGLIFLGAHPGAGAGQSPGGRSAGPEIMHFTGRPSPTPPGHPPPAPFRYGDFEGMQFVPQAARGVFSDGSAERGGGRLPTDYYEPCDDGEDFDANNVLLGKYETGPDGEMERVARLRRPIKIIRKAKPAAAHTSERPAGGGGCAPAGAVPATAAAAAARAAGSPPRNQKKRSAPFQLPVEAAPVKVEPVYCSDATTSEEGSFEASVYSGSEAGDGGESGSLRSSSDAVPGAGDSGGCPSVDADGDGMTAVVSAVAAPQPPAGDLPKQMPHPIAVAPLPLHGLNGGGAFNMPISMAAFKGLLDITDALGRTPLHVAVEAGRSDIVQSLLYNGADATKCLPIDYRFAP